MRIREYEQHCRVQIRSYQAYVNGKYSRNVTNKAWFEEWFRVDCEESLQHVVDKFKREWTE